MQTEIDSQTTLLADLKGRLEKLGQNVRLRIRRGGEERELDMTVRFVELVNYQIVESQSPTPEQLTIREGWLKR